MIYYVIYYVVTLSTKVFDALILGFLSMSFKKFIVNSFTNRDVKEKLINFDILFRTVFGRVVEITSFFLVWYSNSGTQTESGEIKEENQEGWSQGDHYRRQNVGPVWATDFLLFAHNYGISAIYIVIRTATIIHQVQ